MEKGLLQLLISFSLGLPSPLVPIGRMLNLCWLLKQPKRWTTFRSKLNEGDSSNLRALIPLISETRSCPSGATSTFTGVLEWSILPLLCRSGSFGLLINLVQQDKHSSRIALPMSRQCEFYSWSVLFSQHFYYVWRKFVSMAINQSILSWNFHFKMELREPRADPANLTRDGISTLIFI